MNRPSDDQIARWQRQYGVTGVHAHVLKNGACQGELAVYREMTVSERSLLARLEEAEEENPGKRPYMRMVASGCLLWPDTLDEFSTPGIASSELFHRVRQHGHGPLSEDKGEEVPGEIPESMASAFRKARESASRVASDRRYSSEYYRLILRLASMGPERRVNPLTFWELMQMPLGKVRDLSSALEQAHSVLRKEAFEAMQGQGNGREEVAKEVERRYPNIFEGLDKSSGGLTVPGNDLSEMTAEETERPGGSPGDTGYLPSSTPEEGGGVHGREPRREGPDASEVLQQELNAQFSSDNLPQRA